MKVAATPDSAEHSENTTTDTSRNGLRRPRAIRPRADHIGCDRPRQRQPRSQHADLGLAESEIVDDVRGQRTDGIALEEHDAEGEAEQQQQAVLVGEYLALVVGFHRPPGSGLSLFFGVARALTRAAGDYAATAPCRLPILWRWDCRLAFHKSTTAKKNPAPTTKSIWSYAKYGCNAPIAVAPSERAKFTTPM